MSKYTSPLVTIITLNWNQPHYTLDCLRSLQQLTYSNFKVIVLDNGSVDNSVARIQALLPELDYPVEFVVNGKNLGFAEGNNVGIRKALEQGTDYVLLLNNDTEVAPGFIEPLVEASLKDPAVGITGPKIYYYDEPNRIWSAGGIFERNGRTTQLGVNAPESLEFNQARRVDYVTGCAMLVKRAVIEKIGLLDSRFFAYYEEADWCARASRVGFTIWYVPESHLWHKISLKARDLSPLYIYLMTRNRLLFLKNFGKSNLEVWYSLLSVDLRTVVAWTIWKRHKDARPLRRWRLMGMLHYLQGHFGKPNF